MKQRDLWPFNSDAAPLAFMVFALVVSLGMVGLVVVVGTAG